MEKLLAAVLLVFFMTCNTALTCTLYALMILMGFAKVDCVTLSTFILLFTYMMYGVFGVIYTGLVAGIYIACGYMYCMNVSLNDLIEKKKQCSDTCPTKNSCCTDNTCLDTDTCPDTGSECTECISEFDRNVEKIMDFRKNGFKLFCEKTGLNEDKLCRYYSDTCRGFDKVCENCHYCCVRFRNATSGIACMKYVYDCYDKLMELLLYPNIFKSFCQMSSNNSVPDISCISELSGFPDFSEIEDKLNELTPRQKEQIDKMTKDMLSGLFSGTDLSKTIKKIDNKNKKKKK